MAQLMESAEEAATQLVGLALTDRRLAKEAFAFIEDFEWPAIGWQHQVVREIATTGAIRSESLKDHPIVRRLRFAPEPVGDLITQTRLLAYQVVAAKTMMRLGLLLRYSVRFEETNNGPEYALHSMLVDHLTFLVERHSDPAELIYEAGRPVDL